MNDVQHLLEKHGVLAAFNIARKISPADMKKIKNKASKKSKNKEKSDQFFKNEIELFVKKSLENEKIPGIIPNIPPANATTPTESPRITQEKLIKLNNFSNVVTKKCVDNKLSKDEICYILFVVLSSLGVTNEDMENFHRKYGSGTDESD